MSTLYNETRGYMMPKYISLVSFTQEGLKNVKDTRKRAKDFADRAKRMGVTIKDTFWCVGRYDIVHFFEAEDDAAAATGAGRRARACRRDAA